MIEIEKMGKPAVPIISGRFEGDAIASSRAFGMPDLRFVIVPRIYRNLSPEDSIRNTEPAFDELVRMLTVEVDGNGAAYSESVEDVARFEGEDRLDAMLRMNQDYLRRDWGDGFLLMPATRSAIDDLLGGTRLAPDHVVCDMPPGFGIATVEKIAINAAAAGARPDPRRSSTGRCAVSRSRSGHGWCATPGGWCSSSLRWACLERCSDKCWSVSAGSNQHQASEYHWGHRR